MRYAFLILAVFLVHHTGQASQLETLLAEVCKTHSKDPRKFQILSTPVRHLPVREQCFRPNVKARDYVKFEAACGEFSLWALMKMRDLGNSCGKKQRPLSCSSKTIRDLAESSCSKLNPGVRVGITNGLAGCLSPRGLEETKWESQIDELGQNAQATYINLRSKESTWRLGIEIPHAGGRLRAAESMGFVGTTRIVSKDCKSGLLENESP